jgi:LacI family transcriptional regulator
MSESGNSVTIKDLARMCGVSVTTVSLALRNHPRISEETKKRVRAAASKMNYRRNPMMSALMANLSQSRHSLTSVPLAAVYAHNSATVEGGGNPYHLRMWRGISRRAQELGFSVDRFYLEDQKMSCKRLTQILEARGIVGVIIPPASRAGSHLSLDWNSFSALKIGYSILMPNLHRVCQDQYQGIRLAMKQLYRYGYQRPGLMLDKSTDLRSLHLWSSGFYGFEHLNKARGIIPVLECDGDDAIQFRSWYTKHKPDVIICSNADARDILNQAGFKYPGDFGLIALSHRATAPDIAGIDEHAELVGTVAVEQLAQMLYHNERGIPEIPWVIQVPSSWVDGASLPNRDGSPKKNKR